MLILPPMRVTGSPVTPTNATTWLEYKPRPHSSRTRLGISIAVGRCVTAHIGGALPSSGHDERGAQLGSRCSAAALVPAVTMCIKKGPHGVRGPGDGGKR